MAHVSETTIDDYCQWISNTDRERRYTLYESVHTFHGLAHASSQHGPAAPSYLTVRSVILWLLVRAVIVKPTVFMPAMTTADIAKA